MNDASAIMDRSYMRGGFTFQGLEVSCSGVGGRPGGLEYMPKSFGEWHNANLPDKEQLQMILTPERERTSLV